MKTYFISVYALEFVMVAVHTRILIQSLRTSLPTHTLTVLDLEHDWLVLRPWGHPGEDRVGHWEDLERVVGVRELAEEGKVLLEQGADL